ncbi:hypothetical protein LCGC14_1009230 [marine sediment metagenome]|uniref:thymidylate synthase n=1 Tax=marine sediment metagenome TaxID=412755 RepID=A0A0F9N587_9ZZZZ
MQTDTYIKSNHVATIMPDLYRLLLNSGQVAIPRGRVTLEVTDVKIVLTNIQNNIFTDPRRDLNYRFMVAEFIWIMMGRMGLEFLTRYNPKIREFSDDGQTLRGAYGPRVMDQLPHVLNTLAEDPASRQAVINLWQDSPTPSKDIPCTLSLQFLIRDGQLHLIITMRSSDAWLGIPYDIYNFSMIQNCVAGALRKNTRAPHTQETWEFFEDHPTLGTLTLNLGSSHLYIKDAGKVTHLLEQRNFPISTHVPSPQLPGLPPGYIFNPIIDSIVLPIISPLINKPEHMVWKLYERALYAKNKKECLEVLHEAQNA